MQTHYAQNQHDNRRCDKEDKKYKNRGFLGIFIICLPAVKAERPAEQEPDKCSRKQQAKQE